MNLGTKQHLVPITVFNFVEYLKEHAVCSRNSERKRTSKDQVGEQPMRKKTNTSKKVSVIQHQGLCFRCEHRAQFLETGSGPRCECQMNTQQVVGCYMYRPCAPVVMKKASGDKRGVGDMVIVRARSHGTRLLDVNYRIFYLNKRGEYIIQQVQETTKRKAR